MHISSSQRVSALASLLLLAAPSLWAQSANDMVRIEARAESVSDRVDIKGSTADKKSESKTLHIAISGKAKSPETRTGTWTVYGRDLKDHEMTTLESGEFKVELPPVGQQKVDSQTVSSTSTPAHTVTSGGRKGGGRSKRVEGEGTKIYGYSVVVKDGDKVVGEFYDPAGLKNELNKPEAAKK